MQVRCCGSPLSTLTIACDVGSDVANYDGIMVNVMAPFLRAASYGGYGSIREDRAAGRVISLKSDTALWYIPTVAHWGRRIHEIGVCSCFVDYYFVCTISMNLSFRSTLS
jgi:hypothetical protein